MPPQSLLQRFRRLDAYAQNKILDEFRVKSPVGGLVTVVSFFIILFLVLMELTRYLTPEMQPEIVVDGGQTEKMPISFNITFPHMPCYMLGLDIMDEGGTVITAYEHDVYKVRLDAQGQQIHIEKTKELGHGDGPQLSENTECGDCYGAKSPNEDGCCNTCDDVRRAYSDMGWMVKEDQIEQCVREGWLERAATQSQEGCNMHGTILMNRVQGNFHFSPGKAVSYGSQHIHDVRTYLATNHDFQHEIHHLWFGDQKEYTAQLQKRTQAQGLTNPLDNTKYGLADPAFMYQYFLKIVPTQFNFLNGNSVRTYQYSTTRNDRNLREQSAGGLPGVFFNMNFSPMLVVYTESRPSLASFLTNVCAIIGGIFTVASIVDGILFRASIRQRQAMGKAA